MTGPEQNQPYEPPTSSGPTGPDGTEPASGSGYPASSGSGSVYESASYQPPPPEMPPPPGDAPPPVAGGPPPPGYDPYQAPPGGYQQPAYAGGPAAPPAKNNTQLFGILGIVFAVVCCPLLGILFGWLSMNEAKKTGSDDTLGKVGFWLGIGIVALYVVGGIIAVCAGGISGWSTNHY